MTHSTPVPASYLWSSKSFLCTTLTHYSPVCFIPCLADGPEISPEQEEGAVPTYLSHPPHCWEQHLFSLCLALCLFLCLSVEITALSSSLLSSDTDDLFSWIQQTALYCWSRCALFQSPSWVSSPLAICPFHIRHVVTFSIWTCL